jgi:hypothetical protein
MSDSPIKNNTISFTAPWTEGFSESPNPLDARLKSTDPYVKMRAEQEKAAKDQAAIEWAEIQRMRAEQEQQTRANIEGALNPFGNIRVVPRDNSVRVPEGTQPFTTKAEMQDAFADPRYKLSDETGVAFRQAVTNRLAVSNV